MNTAHPPARERGFSLVEMLVALAVTGFTALLLATAIGRIESVVHRGRASTEALADVTGAQLALRERLERMMPVPDPRNPGSAIDFVGQGAWMEWVGAPQDAAAPDAEWRYRLARSADGRVSLYHRSSLDAAGSGNGPSLEGWTAIPLLDRANDLELAYFGAVPFGPGAPIGGGASRGWQRTWSSRRALPSLVRVVVRFADGDRRRWVELVVHPRAVSPDDCPRTIGSDQCGTTI
ncbi:MAG: prepilin-type N-terminal cleavage/methylation domain-containing protein [Novosphingobium sp.]|nr:prepilin-type N-terminal cleavage/methylation domain-containing protein [Novosphingobium sp.]